MRTLILPIAFAGVLCLLPPPPLRAIVRSWDGGGGDNLWSNTLNWSPNGDPGDDDLTIAGVLMGGGPHTVLDTDFVIASLALQNSSEIDTNNFLLAVEGHASVEGAGTRLKLYERQSPGDNDSLDADTLFIGSGAFVEMYENSVLEVDSGPLSLFGTLVGNGTVELVDNPASPTALMSISGTLSAGQAGSFLGAPPARTMTITATDADARIGMTNLGVIEVQNNATLINQVRMLNDHLINLRLYPNSTYHSDYAWHLTGDLDVATNAFSGTAPASIVGGQGNPLLTLDSGSVVTVDFGEQLRFDMQLSANNGSTLANAGTVIFDKPAQFGQLADFQMNGGAPRMIVNSNVSITQSMFDLDGTGLEAGEVRVNEGALLTIDVDGFGGSGVQLRGAITINSGKMVLYRSNSPYALTGTLNLNNTDGTVAEFDGNSKFIVNYGSHIVVGGVGESRILHPQVDFTGGADVDIGPGAILNLEGSAKYDNFNSTFDGEGAFRPGLMTVTNETTFNIAVVDLDDETSPGGPAHLLNARLTINADSIDTSGDGFDGELLITNDGGSTGRLDVNVTGGSWQFDSGTIAIEGSAADFIVLSGSDIEVGPAATIDVNHSARTSARLDVRGTISLADAGDDTFILGDDKPEPHRLIGGQITGAGRIVLKGSLQGFGTIAADVHGFNGGADAALLADDGTLTISGDIDTADVLGTADADGVLQILKPWDTSVTNQGAGSEAGVVLNGGQIKGATITNLGFHGIRGHGLITATIDNRSLIRAEDGGALVLDPSGAPNDWDGTQYDPRILHAHTADLVLRNAGVSSATFEGTISVDTGQEAFVDGFNLMHINDALLELNEGTYRTSGTTQLNAEIVADGAGPSFIVNQASSLLEFGDASATTLNQSLHIDAPNAVIRSLATFSGVGGLVNDQRLVLSDGLGLPVGVLSNGVLDVGSDDLDGGIGSVELSSLTQESGGVLTIDINGLGAGQFDSLLVNNNAVLDGTLEVNLFGLFTPVLGNSWTILTTSLGLVDADNLVLDAPVVDDLTFELIANSNSLVLQVVPAGLAGDFNDDDLVDGYDFLAWQRGESPTPLSPSDLADWQDNYGASASQTAAASVVPEPAAWALMSLAAWGLCRTCPRRRQPSDDAHAETTKRLPLVSSPHQQACHA